MKQEREFCFQHARSTFAFRVTSLTNRLSSYVALGQITEPYRIESSNYSCHHFEFVGRHIGMSWCEENAYHGR